VGGDGRRVAGAGDAEVGELHRALAGQQHVRRLHVAVHDAGRVERAEGRQDAVGDADGLGDGERALAGQVRRQVAALDELHHEEQAALVLAGVVHDDDVRVVEAGGHACLAQEPLPCPELRAGEELHRDRPLEPTVVGHHDASGRAASEILAELVPVGEHDDHGRRA
jgi:hypothetical protein